MTEDQVGRLYALAVDLRERNLNLRHAARIEELTQGEPTPADSLLRLIEERKRVLKALRDAERCGVTSQTEDEIRAAIAFADEPI